MQVQLGKQWVISCFRIAVHRHRLKIILLRWIPVFVKRKSQVKNEWSCTSMSPISVCDVYRGKLLTVIFNLLPKYFRAVSKSGFSQPHIFQWFVCYNGRFCDFRCWVLQCRINVSMFVISSGDFQNVIQTRSPMFEDCHANHRRRHFWQVVLGVLWSTAGVSFTQNFWKAVSSAV
jgi:hypothetical protein